MFKNYSKITRKYKIWNKEKERIFFSEYKKTLNPELKKKLKEKIIKHNLRLVLKLANKNKRKEDDINDLIQEGTIGLLKAIDKFNLEKNNKFSTVAYYWINKKIKDYINKDNNFGYGQNLNNKLRQISHVQEELSKKLKRKPNIEEIVTNMNITKQELIEFQKNHTISIDQNFIKDETFSQYNKIQNKNSLNPEEEYIKKEIKEFLLNLYQKLNEKEKIIMKFRFGIHSTRSKTQTEVGEILEITKQAVSYHEKKLRRKIKKQYEKEFKII